MRKLWAILAFAFALIGIPAAAEAAESGLSEFAGGVSNDTLWGVGGFLFAAFIVWAMIYFLNREK